MLHNRPVPPPVGNNLLRSIISHQPHAMILNCRGEKEEENDIEEPASDGEKSSQEE